MCHYCNEYMSHGNKSISNDGLCDVYIVENMLYILPEGAGTAIKILIEYCPKCGQKLE